MEYEYLKKIVELIDEAYWELSTHEYDKLKASISVILDDTH